MSYRRNVGVAERWVRVLGGALVAACSLSQVGLTPLGIALAAGGVLAAITGLAGYCPACAMAGRRPIEDSV